MYLNVFVILHEKIARMCTKYTSSHYLILCVSQAIAVNFIELTIVCRTTKNSSINKLCLCTKLQNFQVQKSSQILCVHKPYFLILGHIYVMYFEY